MRAAYALIVASLVCRALVAHAQAAQDCRAAFPTLVQRAHEGSDFDVPSIITSINGRGTVEAHVALDGVQSVTLLEAPSVATRRQYVMALRYSTDAATSLELRAGDQVIWGPRDLVAGGHEDRSWTLSFPVCTPPGVTITVDQTGTGHVQVDVVAFEAP